VSKTIEAGIYKEALRLIDEAAQKGLVLRLLGGMGIRHICPSTLKNPWLRNYKDIDFIASRKGREGLEAFLEEQGYEPNRQRNLFSGDKRLLFYDLTNERQVDVFIGVFDMCHLLELEERLTITNKSLTPEDLFLTKIQIIELNEKDILDLGVLLLDTPFDENKEKGGLDPLYIARICSKDWGWYKTVTKNINEIKPYIAKLKGVPDQEKDKIIKNLENLEAEIKKHPKTLGWKTRSLIGDKVPWYNLPEDLG